MNREKADKKLLYIFLSALFVLQLVFIFLNEKTFGGADSISHFQIAKFAFKYPELFLDHWGKPVYTTLSAPFAFWGFKMAQVFNLLAALIALWFVYKIAEEIYRPGAFYIVVFTAFAPIYFQLMTACLTEILFSLVLVVSVWLFLKNRLIFAAIVLSFLPFVRTESIVILPIFAVAFLLKRKWLPVLLLATGTIFYSVVGYFVFDDFFWIVNRFPYPKGESVYGSGSLFHFIIKSNYIFGIPFIVLLLTGLYSWGLEIFKKFDLKNTSLILFVVIAGSWLTYFAAHSFVWWRGMGGSLGLIRVIGAVIPLAALTALKGVQFIFEKIQNRKIAIGVIVFLSVAQVFLFFNKNHYPTKTDAVDKLIQKSSAYLMEHPQPGRVFYFNPEFVFYLGLDPYDNTKLSWGVGDKLQPSNSMEFGDVLIWDAHFGPNEGKVSPEAVANDSNLQLLKTFLPVENITVLGGYDYEIRVYKKVKKKVVASTEKVFKRGLEITPGKSDKIITLENENVLEIPKSDEYSPTIVVYTNELKKENLFEATLTLQFKSDEVIATDDVFLVISVENGKDKLRYASLPVEWGEADKTWKTVSLKTRFNADIPETAIIKMYIWNRGHKHIFVKEFGSEIVSF